MNFSSAFIGDTEWRLVSRTKCPVCANLSWKVLGRRLAQTQGWTPWKKSGLLVSVVQCRVCGVITCDPFPVRLPEQVYARLDPETYFANTFREFHRRWKHIRRVLAMLSIHPDWRILDAGAGIGIWTHAFIHQLGIRNILAVDISPAFVEYGRKKLQLPPYILQTGNLETTELPANSYDLIFCHQVLEHVSEPGRVMERFARWLRPGGFLYLVVPYGNWLPARWLSFYYRLMGEPLTVHLSPFHPPFHLYEFVRSTFRWWTQHGPWEIVWIRVLPETMLASRWVSGFLEFLHRILHTGMELEVVLMKSVFAGSSLQPAE